MPTLPRQHTLAEGVSVSGVGFFTGRAVTLILHPAAENVGRIFVRSDLRGQPEIPAWIDFAAERDRRTALERDGARVELTEHVLAALSGHAVDNCFIEMDGPEPPGGDGSARHFSEAIVAAGVVEQQEPAAIFEIPGRCVVAAGQGRIVGEANPSPLASRLRRRRGAPAEGPRHPLHLSYELDYPNCAAIGRQSAEFAITPESFGQEITGARTFILESEIAALRKEGYGQKVTAADLLVFGETGVIDNDLRADNECARHKLLDCLGDFALLGGRLAGRVTASRSGHALNRQFVRELAGSSGVRRAA